jgi:hypothetical protein
MLVKEFGMLGILPRVPRGRGGSVPYSLSTVHTFYTQYRSCENTSGHILTHEHPAVGRM